MRADAPVDRKRRRAMALVGLLVGYPVVAGTLRPTPRQTAGPFYPSALPLDHDADLTRVAGREAQAEGRVTALSGRVLDASGRPLRGLRIEIWQCDARGHYHHALDRLSGEADPNFQGFGRATSDGEGRYRFRTIHPVPYPGRTPHVHFAVYPPGAKRFTTQLYVEGEPRNEQDFLFRRIPPERRSLVLARFVPAPSEAGGELAAHFDIVLGGTPRA